MVVVPVNEMSVLLAKEPAYHWWTFSTDVKQDDATQDTVHGKYTHRNNAMEKNVCDLFR